MGIIKKINQTFPNFDWLYLIVGFLPALVTGLVYYVKSGDPKGAMIVMGPAIIVFYFVHAIVSQFFKK